MIRWLSFLTRRPALAEPHHIPITAQPDPLVMLRAEIYADVARRREARLARPAPSEAKRFKHARPKLDQIAREIATMPVPF